MPPRIFDIRLVVETDDDQEVQKLVAAISALACPQGDFADHSCRLPWFVLTSELEGEDVEELRDLLNR